MYFVNNDLHVRNISYLILWPETWHLITFLTIENNNINIYIVTLVGLLGLVRPISVSPAPRPYNEFPVEKGIPCAARGSGMFSICSPTLLGNGRELALGVLTASSHLPPALLLPLNGPRPPKLPFWLFSMPTVSLRAHVIHLLSRVHYANTKQNCIHGIPGPNEVVSLVATVWPQKGLIRVSAVPPTTELPDPRPSTFCLL